MLKYLILAVTVVLTGCFPDAYEYKEECTVDGVYVALREDTTPSCAGFKEYHEASMEVIRGMDINFDRLLERLPYVRVVVGGYMPAGTGGFTNCDAALIFLADGATWAHTALAHEYVHLANDCLDIKHEGWVERGIKAGLAQVEK